MRKLNLILGSILVLVFLVSNSSLATQFKWKVNSAWSPTALETKAVDRFIELVQKKSKGQIKLSHFPSKQLGDSIASLEMLGAGQLELNVDTTSWLFEVSRMSDWLALAFPYVIKDAEHLRKIQKSAWYLDLNEKLFQKNGIKILADNGYRLPRQLIHRTKALSKPEDVIGVKLRMASGKMFFKPWQDFGADVMTIPWGEAAMALQTGLVEGMDAPAQTIYPMKFYEGGRHITLTSHQRDTLCIEISRTFWEKLTPELQEMMVSSAKEASDWFTGEISSVWANHQKILVKEGVSFHEADGEAWRKKAVEIARKWEAGGEWPKGLFEKIQGM